MARRTVTLDEKILAAEAVVTKTKRKYDAAVDELEKLIAKRRERDDKKLLSAYHAGDKTVDEIVAFIHGDTEEKWLMMHKTRADMMAADKAGFLERIKAAILREQGVPWENIEPKIMEDIEKCFRFDEERIIAMDLEIRFEQHVPEKNPLKFDWGLKNTGS